MWHEKMIRISWWVLALNLAVAFMNIGFGYQRIVNNEMAMAAFTFTLVAVNLFVAWLQYKNVVKFRQQLKDLTWELLQKPSEQMI